MRESKPPNPVHVRSILLLELASELLLADRSWPADQARLLLRKQGNFNPWQYCFFASDAPSVIDEVVQGGVQLAMLNPAEPLAMAVRGTGPFREPLPLRIITVIPSYDQFAFAVAERTGLKSLHEIVERRYPLRVSMRQDLEHADYLMANEVFRAAGFTLDDIVRWGGSIHRHPGLRVDVGMVERGEIDTWFEEGVSRWLGDALKAGMRLLPLEPDIVRRLEPIGLRTSKIRTTDVPELLEDVTSLDFSGWPVFTHAEAPDELVRAFCSALETRKDRIPWEGGWSLPLDRMCKDGPDTPLTAPLHPAAEAFWRECGYLP